MLPAGWINKLEEQVSYQVDFVAFAYGYVLFVFAPVMHLCWNLFETVLELCCNCFESVSGTVGGLLGNLFANCFGTFTELLDGFKTIIIFVDALTVESLLVSAGTELNAV